MRNLLSERNVVCLLFVTSLVVLFFAKQDTNKVEKSFRDAISSSAVQLSFPKATARNADTTHQPGSPANNF